VEKARLGRVDGPLVDPAQFLARATPRYKEHGIFPYCDACHEIVHLYGAHSTNPAIIPRFDHPDLPPDADPLDDCVLANRNPRLRGLSPDGYDDVRGKRIRDQFLDSDQLRQAYAFCLDLCRKGNLPAAKFRSMLHRADRKRVWSYSGIQAWAIPYVLLTLENFSARSKGGKEYGFHFVLQKPRGTNISALWSPNQECRLSKVFSSDGKPVVAQDNPYPVSKAAFASKAGDTSWITPEFLRTLIPEA
jgi:hypothetical protein